MPGREHILAHHMLIGEEPQQAKLGNAAKSNPRIGEAF